jgi:predicted nucleotidyltransferase
MTPRFLDFSGKLQPFEDLFRELIRATSAQDISFFVVGAFARDIIMMAHGIAIKRATEDVDFGIQVKSWEQFQQLKDSLINTKQFKPDKKQQQRIKYRDLVEVDIVPFGSIEKDGAITWPAEETVMITLGFDEAYKDTILARLAEDIEIRICSLAGLTLMKLIAWNDRRARYRKDAEDLGFIMSTYLDAGNRDRILGEEAEQGDLLTADFDYFLAGARLLGRDVARLLTDRSYAPIMKILDEQTGERNQYPLVEAMLRSFYGEFQKALSMLESLKQGILDVRG